MTVLVTGARVCYHVLVRRFVMSLIVLFGTYGVDDDLSGCGEGDGLLDSRRGGGDEAGASTAHAGGGIRGGQPRRIGSMVLLTLVSRIGLGVVLCDGLSGRGNSLVPRVS